MKRRFCALIAVLFLLLTSCAGKDAAPFAAFAPPEGKRLCVYTSHKEEVYLPIVREFEERTGIWVEVVTGGTTELLERIESEAKAPRCDVMFGGGGESLTAYAALFEPYTCGGIDAVDEALRPAESLYTPFSTLPIVLIRNPRMVSADDLTGWEDLLDEAWRGRIAFADPTVSGSSYTALMTMLSALPGDEEELLSRFHANLDGAALPDSGDVAEAVAMGRLPVGVTLEQSALQYAGAGEKPAIVYPKEGTSALADGTALIAAAPHRENAIAFLEFTISYDAQAQTAERLYRRSVRSDVPDREELPARGDFPLIDYDVSWASSRKEEMLRRWAQLEGEAIG